MNEQNINGAIVLTFDNIEQTGKARHCFTTRLGDGSAAGFDPERTVCGKQVHKTVVRAVTAQDANDPGKLEGVDGFITNVRGLALSTYHADCVPLFFLEPEAGVIGLAHAGWRGTLGRIGAKTVSAMVKTFGCQPQRIVAGIGPSIGPCCFEVSNSVAELFLAEFPRMDGVVKPTDVKPDKSLIDLWAINRRILWEAGLLDVNIESSVHCTMCNSRLFHSFRRDGADAGRMRAFLQLR